MPSAMARPLGLAATAVSAIGDALGADKAPPLTPRQSELNRRWRWYSAAQYATRGYNWDGTKRVSQDLADQFAAQGFINQDAAGQVTYDALPTRYRHPASPYHLARSITRRFTGLLFGSDKHPSVECDDDTDTNEFVQGLVTAARLWPAMTRARTFGGAMGSVGLTFRFVRGRPVIQVLDPRWCTPAFRDIALNELDSVEYMYPYAVTDRQGREQWWLYRRVITTMTDVTFEPVPCDTRRPVWVERQRVDHGLGFFPGVWVQNTYVEEDCDGEPDCWGVYDQLEEMDRLFSAASVGAISNSDPTLVLKTKQEIGQVRKGSKFAIKLDQGDEAEYLEMTGTGGEAAIKLAMIHRGLALETAECVIDDPSQTERTATEVTLRTQAMWNRAEDLREQYGTNGIQVLVQKMVAAARALSGGGLRAADGRELRLVVTLPPIVRKSGGKLQVIERQVGRGAAFSLTWPPFSRRSPQEANTAAQAVANATQSGAIDRATGTTYLAPYFGGGDAAEIRARADAELSAAADAGSDELLRGLAAGGTTAGAAPAGPTQWTLEELKLGACTVDEYRAGRGAPPMADGAGERTVTVAKPTKTADLEPGDVEDTSDEDASPLGGESAA